MEDHIYTIRFLREGKEVCKVLVPLSFLKQLPEVKLFKKCIDLDFKEQHDRVININHPKLTREIAIQYMKSLKFRTTRVAHDIDPAHGGSIYLAAIADYCGDSRFEQPYYAGEQISIIPVVLVPVIKMTDDQWFTSAIPWRKHIDEKYQVGKETHLDPITFELKHGYKTEEDLMDELEIQLPPWMVLDRAFKRIHPIWDSDRDFWNHKMFGAHNLGGHRCGNIFKSFIDLHFTFQELTLNPKTCDNDYPAYLTPWAACLVAEDYLDNIASEPVNKYRKLINFAERNPIIATIIWDNDRVGMLDLIGYPKKGRDTLLKLPFKGVHERATRLAATREPKVKFDDPELNRIEALYKEASNRFYGSGVWKEYKALIRRTGVNTRSRIREDGTEFLGVNPLLEWDKLNELDAQWWKRYNVLEKSAALQSKSSTQSKKVRSPVL
jgi:hypothetical protein